MSQGSDVLDPANIGPEHPQTLQHADNPNLEHFSTNFSIVHSGNHTRYTVEGIGSEASGY